MIHRDLKPGNVMLTRSGAKLLDFGLAKQGPEAAPPISSALITRASPLTAQGTIVGTWQYMSPEQLEGGEADARSDIFAFGALLYEMVTGRPAFHGKSQASLIAAIMGSEPPSPSTVAPTCPPALDRVIRRCLAKDPDARWHSAADLADSLRWVAEGGAPASTASGTARPGAMSGAVSGPSLTAGPGSGTAVLPATRAGRRERLLWMSALIVILLAAVALSAWPRGGAVAPRRPIRASLLPPPGARFDQRFAPAVSPDGRTVAFVAIDKEGVSRLWIRDLDATEARVLQQTDDAAFPFWSPDGKWIAFFSGDKLMKTDVAGGPAIPLCDAQDGRGGSWSREGVIVFQPRFSAELYKVPAGGGAAEPITKLDAARFDVAHRWPLFLPDGRHFLFFVVSTTNPATSEHTGIYVGSLDAPETRLVLRAESRMAYAQGHLLYRQSGSLMAQPFDADRLVVTGDAIPVSGDLSGNAYSWGGAEFGVAESGVLVFLPGAGGGETELAWFDRAGKRLGRVGEPGVYWEPRLSRDGRRLAFGLGEQASDLWIHDLERDVRSRFTFDPADDATPVWSSDSTRIAFVSNRKGIGEIYQRPTAGTGEEELLFAAGTSVQIDDWSTDGRTLFFSSLSRETGFDLWTYSFDDGQARAWLAGPLDQGACRISPDGRWIAYGSSESGRFEVYVQAYPGPAGSRWQVSQAGGSAPVWNAGGTELYYLGLDGTLTAVEIRKGAALEVGTPRRLFRVEAKPGLTSGFDVSPDATRFLVNAMGESDTAGQAATLLLDWTGLLRR